jgi:hypothetical protein
MNMESDSNDDVCGLLEIVEKPVDKSHFLQKSYITNNIKVRSTVINDGKTQVNLLITNKNTTKLTTQQIQNALDILTRCGQSMTETEYFTLMNTLRDAYNNELMEIYTQKRPNPLFKDLENVDKVLEYVMEWDIFWTQNYTNIPAHPTAKIFPGVISNNIPRISKTMTVNGNLKGNHYKFGYSGPNSVIMISSGLYANAGETISITIPENIVNKSFLIIGCHKDNLTNKKDTLKRFPVISRQYSLTNINMNVISAFGGLVYFGIRPNSKLGKFDITISNCCNAPTYFLDKTTTEEWDLIKNVSVPWGEIVGNNIICTYPQKWLKDVVDPKPIAEYWDKVVRYQDNMVGIDRTLIRPERIVLDVQISAGSMHSGYPIMGHTVPKHINMLKYEHLTTVGNWGPFHELGHNHQFSPWALPGHLEVSCNIFAYLVSVKLANNDNNRTPAKQKETLDGFLKMKQNNTGWNEASDNIKFQFYIQLLEGFGWNKMKEFFTWYTNANENEFKSDTNEKNNLFCLRYSLAVGYNLTQYFQAWKFNITQSTIDKIKHLPVWDDYHKNIPGGKKENLLPRITDPKDGVPVEFH